MWKVAAVLFSVAAELFDVLYFLGICWDVKLPLKAILCKGHVAVTTTSQVIHMWTGECGFANRNHQGVWRVRDIPLPLDPHPGTTSFLKILQVCELWGWRQESVIKKSLAEFISWWFADGHLYLYTFSGGSAWQLQLLSGHWYRSCQVLGALKWEEEQRPLREESQSPSFAVQGNSLGSELHGAPGPWAHIALMVRIWIRKFRTILTLK